MRFVADYEVPAHARSYYKDYTGSRRDRGHSTSNATIDYSKKSQKQSFLMTNIYPQAPGLNRYGLAEIEKQVRNVTKKHGEVYMVTGCLVDDDPLRIGKHRVAVPYAFYKAIYVPKTKSVYGWLTPNSAVSAKRIRNFRVSIDEIELKAGVDLFSVLPDALENRIEKTVKKL